ARGRRGERRRSRADRQHDAVVGTRRRRHDGGAGGRPADRRLARRDHRPAPSARHHPADARGDRARSQEAHRSADALRRQPRGGAPGKHALMRRKLRIALGAVALFLILLVLLFPTERILRSVAASLSKPGGTTVLFRSASLRPWGLTIEGPSLSGPDGTVF